MNAHPKLILRESADTLERRDVTARPQSFDAERLTVEAVIATSNPVERRDERGQPFLEILDVNGADLSALRGASVLDGHRQNGVGDVLGVVEEARVEGEQIVARIRLSSRPELAGVVTDVRDGILRGLSIGYSVAQWQDGERNGRRTRTAVKWTPREVSLVAVSADPAARTRMQDDTSRAAINRGIRELGHRCGVSQATVDDLIDRESTIEQARAAMLEHMTTRSALSIRAGGSDHRTLDNPVEFQRAAGEALFARVHRSHTLSGPARQFADAPMASIAAECLRRSGESVTLMQPAAIITRALQTTSDFPMILGDAVGRVLREAYRAAPSGLRQLARQTTLPDFRERASLMLDPTSFKLERTNEHGEFKSGGFVETGEKYKLATYGKIFGLTRQSIINDDLGALADVPAKLGAQAAAFEADYLAALLQSGAQGVGPGFADGKPLFDATHANLGDTTPLGDAGLTAGRLLMRKQVGPSGELIDVVPAFLVVPPDLETLAEKLLATITAITTADVNVWSRLGLIVEPRLTDATRYYLFAAPPASGLEVAYLTGSEGPQVETQAGFRIDGVETKVRLDFVAAFVDWHGAVMYPGGAQPSP